MFNSKLKLSSRLGEFSRADCLFGEDGGDEDDAVALGQNEISGENGGSADTDRSVDRGEGHIDEAEGIVAAVEAVEVGDLTILFVVPDPGIEDEAGVGVGGNATAEIGADQGAFEDLSVAVGNVDVAKSGDR